MGKKKAKLLVSFNCNGKMANVYLRFNYPLNFIFIVIQ